MSRFLLAVIFAAMLLPLSASDYSIQAIRFGTAPGVAISDLVVGGPKDKVDIAFVIWLIRGGGHTILFDSGFHRDTFLKMFPTTDYLRPDEAVKLAGVQPADVTDIVISHAHWDHMDGLDLFPKAQVWIQKDEYRYYTMDAWLPGGDHGGIDPEDVKELVQLNTEGRIHLARDCARTLGGAVEPGLTAARDGRRRQCGVALRADAAHLDVPDSPRGRRVSPRA